MLARVMAAMGVSDCAVAARAEASAEPASEGGAGSATVATANAAAVAAAAAAAASSAAVAVAESTGKGSGSPIGGTPVAKKETDGWATAKATVRGWFNGHCKQSDSGTKKPELDRNAMLLRAMGITVRFHAAAVLA